MERTDVPPIMVDVDPSPESVSETYYSSVEGKTHRFVAARSDREVEEVVRWQGRRFPGAHLRGVPVDCPSERLPSLGLIIDYAPAEHGESCRLETTVDDPAAYLEGLLERLRGEGKEFEVLTRLKTTPHAHGKETTYSIGGRVGIGGPAAEEVLYECVLPWLASFRCGVCKDGWFETEGPEPGPAPNAPDRAAGTVANRTTRRSASEGPPYTPRRESGPLGGDLPVPAREVLELLQSEATRRGFRLMVAFIRDDGDMKVHHAVNGEVMFDRRRVPVPRPKDPEVDASAVADLVRKEATKRGLTFVFLSMEEGDGGTGGNTPEHIFGDPESLGNYLEESERAEGRPLVTVNYSRLHSWPEQEDR
jgi:hypothetical protein